MSEERSFRIRPNLARHLREKCGKSWKAIAKECGIHPGSIKRWLANEPVLMDNIGRLAIALNTTADKLILHDGEDDLTDYVEAEIVVAGDYNTVKQPDDITAILAEVQKRIGAHYRIMLMYVGPGSIKIGIKIYKNDLMRLIKGLIRERLSPLQITTITIHSVSSLRDRADVSPPPKSDLLNLLKSKSSKPFTVKKYKHKPPQAPHESKEPNDHDSPSNEEHCIE